MRATCGPSILETACFPLVPFSNRIANGRFEWKGQAIVLTPNLPDSDHPHPLHGFGWLSGWEVLQSASTKAVLGHRYNGGEWPWNYEAEQGFELDQSGLVHSLMVRNLSDIPMPAGLGFHPYFPKDEQTIYHGLHRGEWQTSDDVLPRQLVEAERAMDWWKGQPVGTRSVDTVYTEREGSLKITQPTHGYCVEITPSSNLPFTVVYSPKGEDYFCLEGVSHPTNALNCRTGANHIAVLEPGEHMRVAVSYTITSYTTTQRGAGDRDPLEGASLS
ncbi:MAG: aldose 1-epimerase [Myxococcales bacterium]|nr:aldose 1-epimerase [Myxococcales bacterium]